MSKQEDKSVSEVSRWLSHFDDNALISPSLQYGLAGIKVTDDGVVVGFMRLVPHAVENSDSSPVECKYVSRPCGYGTPEVCRFCNGPYKDCHGKCLAACKARSF